ncbi:hypothetical protein [Actinomadura sp. 7K534]|uniref:hypothetical protein n=1 Tax=Actinomadura sp. 7K534 TaxID=2530366 RepID=UPI001A9D9610|nr:hypothetical protein [Actinomadura sp. 7K534]
MTYELHLTRLAVHRVGMPDAIGLVSDGIQRTARYAGVTQKCHATVSRAWVELVAHHAAEHATPDFGVFIDRYPALLDKRLLTRFYRSTTLAGPQARPGWVDPIWSPSPGRAAITSGPKPATRRSHASTTPEGSPRLTATPAIAPQVTDAR